MKRIVGLFVLGVVAVFAMAGCGGGDGGSAANEPSVTPLSVTPPSQSLQGRYAFVGFDLEYSNGTTSVTINESSPVLSSWSGTMEFGANTLSQSFVIDNTATFLTGTVTITWTTAGVSGIAHVTDNSGTHDLPFTISGNTLTTYSGVVPYGSPGLTVQEFDYWIKISDSVSPETKGSVTERSDVPAYSGKRWIAELLVP